MTEDEMKNRRIVEHIQKDWMLGEEIGKLEWESADLEMFYIEQCKEKHPKEFTALLQAQAQKLVKHIETYIVGVGDSIEYCDCGCGGIVINEERWQQLTKEVSHD